MRARKHIDFYTYATLGWKAELACAIESSEFAELLWKWDDVEFSLTVDSDVLRELVRQGNEALDVIARFAEIERTGRDTGRVCIRQNAPTVRSAPGAA